MGMVSVSGTGNVQVNQALAVGLYTSSESVLVAPDGACVCVGGGGVEIRQNAPFCLVSRTD